MRCIQIQLSRIQLRVPDYGWTTQKVFHMLNVVICLLRALTFGLYTYVDELEEKLHKSTVQFFIFDLASKETHPRKKIRGI